MGVSGLKKLMEQYEVDIDMCEKIKSFHRQLRDTNDTGARRPIIIFDFLPLCYLYLNGTVGVLGGRHELNLKNIRKILGKLVDSGADLIFICDGQIQNGKISEWCKRHNEKDERAINCMKAGYAGNELTFPCNQFVSKVFDLLATMKCKVIVSTKVDCDQAIAKYAVENKQKVLAVVSGDSDMVIFEGNFQLWSIDLASLQNGKAKQLNRQALLTSLNLTQNQLKFYATIKGNDFTRHYMHGDKKEMVSMHSNNVCSLVRRIFSTVGDLNGSVYEEVTRALLIDGIDMTKDHLKSIEQGLQFYELNFELETSQETVNLLKYCLEKGVAFQYSVQFLDFDQRCNEKFINLILQAIERSAGVLKEQQPDNSHIDEIIIITKTQNDAEGMYEEHILAPLPVPRFEDVDQNGGGDNKWKNVLFCLGLRLTIQQLKTVIKKFAGNKGFPIVKIILSIQFLRQAKEITTSQADAFIVVHSEDSTRELYDPHRSNYETIRTAQIYQRTLMLVDDILHICGLNEYTTYPVRYDGAYYDYLMKGEENLEHKVEHYIGSELRGIIYE